MNIDQLRYLIEINRCKSLAQAAENLHISHQALSASIKSLENELKTHLTEKTPRGTKLTLKGKQLVEISYDFIYALDDIFYQEKEEKLIQITIASSYSCITNFLVDKIEKMHINPVYIETSENIAIIEQVQKNNADIGFCSVFFHNKESKHENFKNIIMQYPMLECRMVAQTMLFCELAETHPLAYLEKIPLHKLKKYSLVYFYPRTDIQEMDSQENLQQKNVFEQEETFVEYFKDYNFTIENNPAIYTHKIKTGKYIGIAISAKYDCPYMFKRIPLSDECYFEVFAVRKQGEKQDTIKELLYNIQ